MSDTTQAAPTRRLSRPGLHGKKLEEIKEVLSRRFDENGEDFSIIVAQIDPDALGAATGMEEFLSLLGYASQIYYVGKVGHPQNEALCNKLVLMEKMKPLTADINIFNEIFVDSSKIKDSRLPRKAFDPALVVDHHQDSDIHASPRCCVWIDHKIGSASTMVLEMLSAVAPPDYELPQDVALALALGVYTDTKDLVRTSDRDTDAYAWAKRRASYTDLIQLILYKRPFQFLRNLARAVLYVDKHDTFKHGHMAAFVGILPEKRGDDLAMICDEFLRTTGAVLAITWAVIECKQKDGSISKKVRLCARSEDLGTTLNEKLGDFFRDCSGAKMLPDGASEGGALFELPGLDPWITDVEDMIPIMDRKIREWFFEGIDPEETEGDDD